MGQFNLHMTPEFERTLERLVSIRGFRSKSDAVRIVVREALDEALGTRARGDFGRLRGLAAGGAGAARQFQGDDDLWR